VPGFDELVDQERPVRLIKAAIKNGHIPNAFLFTGLNGIGKKSAALSFAMACNCLVFNQVQAGSSQINSTHSLSQVPCGSCGSCKKIISGSHPDIHIVRPEGSVIKVEQIRALCQRLSLKPNEASIRLALISDAQMLNPEAGNTLLKTLEEPPDHTVFILTALQSSDLLPTIVSRCRHIRFNPVSRERLSALLENKYGLGSTDAHVYAAMSGGSLTMAIAMAESNWIKRRNWIIKQVENLTDNPSRFNLAFSEVLSKNKKWLSDALFILKMWFRDLIVSHFSPENIVNTDLREKIQKASLETNIETTLSKMQAIEEAEHNIIANANIRTTLDALVTALFGEK
jgi:DNA polymerase III subunit delta'